ncbi:polysaccharide biosynthesis/export family protein [Sphingobacterium wenxiniae]|uniref:Protein involved in polysaccharide export, contains SLBB domain of the beta-grasp fold n=1 Tax=Sphingobacterium wenxiniae TaxID=683125 RepID=A0A1I6U7K0_9SPHI|nr:SLBB domain-containing protein [Sphingobacterium wenxiniae]SFS97371.1 protein involved in polysaccharide export, contains SLBB domain of the beta-grasp fold [Sphingobacterium wenxiniae]
MKKSIRHSLRTLIGVFLVFVCTSIGAQIRDFSKIQVDQLTEPQIENLWSRAEQQEMSDQDLYNSLQQQGMPNAEITKLRVRITALKKKRENERLRKGSPATKEKTKKVLLDQDWFTPLVDTLNEDIEIEEELDKQFQIFGSELFKNNAISFEPNMNMPTPKGYVVGAGDQLSLDITGDNEASYELTVTPEGAIKVEYAGLINIAGLSVEAARTKISNRLTSIYPAIRSGRTKVDLNLAAMRSIKVTMTGFVTQPGTYTLPAVATVFNALYAAGGPNDQGSFRSIQVLRNNEVVSTIDAYDFLVNGLQAGNIRLEDQDVIHIPVYISRVQMEGLVRRVGFFEIKDGETFADLLRYAGGFDNKAYTARVKVLRSTGKDVGIFDIKETDFAIYKPFNGDHYIVEEILERYANRVVLDGAVFRAGDYELTPGLTVGELLKRGEGIREDAFTARAYVQRLNPDNTQRLLSFDLKKLLDGEIEDIPLRREDRLVVTSIFDLRDEYFVTIDGEVRHPGQLDYAEEMTLGSAIQMAGGLSDAANIERIEVARRIRRNINERDSVLSELMVVKFDNKEEAVQSDFVLQPFDMISIRTSTGYQLQRQVRIEGEVRYPGVYTLVRKDERISDLIERAGGFTEYAYLEGASLQRIATSSEIAVQSSRSATSLDNNLIDSLELQNEENRNAILGKIKEGQSKTNLYFNKYIGIDLKRIVKRPESRLDIFLEEGDVLTVPRQLQTVKIVGEVLSPISVVYQKGRNLKYYVNQAGGYTSRAHKSKTFVQYANGSVKGTQKGLGRIYPEIRPGAEIIIPQKPEKQKISVQAIVGLTSGLVSMTAILVTLFRR